MRLRLATTCVLLVASLCARSAFATDLSVRTIEFGSWPAAVAALEADVQGEGRTVHVFVHDERGIAVPCEQYTLTLDAIAVRAFEPGHCDRGTGATEIRLAHRSALFAHDGDLVPRPLPAGITATEIRTVGASGGAGNSGGSELSCTLAVRPYLTNLETGERVYLTPGRFAMRVLDSSVTASGNGGGWTLRGAVGGTLTVGYEVIDTRRNQSVLRDRATLRCDRSPIEDMDAVAIPAPHDSAPERTETHVATSCGDAPTLDDHGEFGGSTLGGARQPLYRIEVSSPRHVVMHLESEFGGTVSLFASCPSHGAPVVASDVFGGGEDQRLHWDLAAGVYYLQITDADIERHHGTYWFRNESYSDPITEIAAQAGGRAPESDGPSVANCQLSGEVIREDGAILDPGVRCAPARSNRRLTNMNDE